MDVEGFLGGGDVFVRVVDHEIHDVQFLFRSADDASIDGDLFFFEDFFEVFHYVHEYEIANAHGIPGFGGVSDVVEHFSGRAAEHIVVAVHVHVAEAVDVVAGNRFGV